MEIEKALQIVNASMDIDDADRDRDEYAAAIHSIVKELEAYRAIGTTNELLYLNLKKKNLWYTIVDWLPSFDEINETDNFASDGDLIYCRKEAQAETLANLIDQVMGGQTCTTGYLSPDEIGDTVGWYYIN